MSWELTLGLAPATDRRGPRRSCRPAALAPYSKRTGKPVRRPLALHASSDACSNASTLTKAIDGDYTMRRSVGLCPSCEWRYLRYRFGPGLRMYLFKTRVGQSFCGACWTRKGSACYRDPWQPARPGCPVSRVRRTFWDFTLSMRE